MPTDIITTFSNYSVQLIWKVLKSDKTTAKWCASKKQRSRIEQELKIAKKKPVSFPQSFEILENCKKKPSLQGY